MSTAEVPSAARLDAYAGLASVWAGLLTYGVSIIQATDKWSFLALWAGASLLVVGGYVLHRRGRTEVPR